MSYDPSTFDVAAVRANFPALAITDDGKPRVYLDNPAGTQVPRSVAEAMTDCMLHANANLGGPFATSVAAGHVVDAAHEAMADLLNARSAREIVFGQNMTTLTFHISRSIGRLLSPGDEIILSQMDHDANVTPWRMLAADLGVTVRELEFDTERYEFNLAHLEDLLSDRTRLVCVGYASNLLGTVNDIAGMAERVHGAGALLYVDAVHYAPHGPIDVQALGCDFLVCSAYKFFGPHQGALWGRESLLADLVPYKLEPAPNGLPGRFETGTQSHEGLAGVTAAIDYLASLGDASCAPGATRRERVHAGMHAIHAYEATLSDRLVNGLSRVPGLTVRGITDASAMARRSPTVSFTIDGIHPDALSVALGERNVFTWSGHSYALGPTRAMGLLESGGVLRVGAVHYNTTDEIDYLVECLQEIAAKR